MREGGKAVVAGAGGVGARVTVGGRLGGGVAAEEYLVDDGWKVVEVEPEAVAVNGNGHIEEAPEPQQSLFSWAEFMAEEPVKSKGRVRKTQPAPVPLFEWTLDLEQEREPVGAGR